MKNQNQNTGRRLTFEELSALSLGKSEISQLINEGLITKKGAFFTYNSINNIFEYYFELIRLKNLDLAHKCLNLCYLLDPSKNEVNYELFALCIKNGEFQKSTKYLRNLLNNSSQKYQPDYLFYLYLLSTIINLPEDLKIIAKSLKSYELLVSDDREDIYKPDTENKLRTLTYAQKFLQSMYILGENRNLVERKKDYHVKFTLIQSAAAKQVNEKNATQDLLTDKKYLECYLLLKQFSQTRQLSLIEKFTLMALEDLLSMIYTHKLPTRINRRPFRSKPINIFDMIYSGNYRTAIEETRKLTNIKENVIYKVLIAIQEEFEHIIELSTLEMINENVEPVKPVTEDFYELLNKGLPIYTINKILRLSTKKQFKCLLYAAKEFYISGDIKNGDRLIEFTKALNYTNEKMLEDTSALRTHILTQKKNI